jgi:alpha-beta hydrolase superfamily lysophospholipase
MFEAAAGTRLLHASLPFRIDPPGAKEAVLLLHGFTGQPWELSDVGKLLAGSGFAVYAPRYPGHGTRRVDFLATRAEDWARRAIDAYLELRADYRTVHVLGHSMGGLIAIAHVMDHPGEAKLLMVSSPGLGVAIAVPKWKDTLGQVMSKVWPSLAIPTGISATLLSRDPAVVSAYTADPMVTKSATARWYTEFLETQNRSLAAARALALPVFHQYGDKDELVSVSAQRTWFERLGSNDKELVAWPGLYHEIMNEPEQAEVIGRYIAWLDRHTA